MKSLQFYSALFPPHQVCYANPFSRHASQSRLVVFFSTILRFDPLPPAQDDVISCHPYSLTAWLRPVTLYFPDGYPILDAVAVLSMHLRAGASSKLVQYVMHSLKVLGCITVNLQIRSITAEDAAFYKPSCFSVIPPFRRQAFHKCVEADALGQTKLEKSKIIASSMRGKFLTESGETANAS
jgi:hypothetical protein